MEESSISAIREADFNEDFQERSAGELLLVSCWTGSSCFVLVVGIVTFFFARERWETKLKACQTPSYFLGVSQVKRLRGVKSLAGPRSVL